MLSPVPGPTTPNAPMSSSAVPVRLGGPAGSDGPSTSGRRAAQSAGPTTSSSRSHSHAPPVGSK